MSLFIHVVLIVCTAIYSHKNKKQKKKKIVCIAVDLIHCRDDSRETQVLVGSI